MPKLITKDHIIKFKNVYSPSISWLKTLFLLHLGTDQTNKEKELNLPRLCIQKFFPKKKCFVIERPGNSRQLAQVESLQDKDLDPDFVEQVTEFCSYVLSCSKIKMLSGGIRVNGPRESLPSSSAYCLGHSDSFEEMQIYLHCSAKL